MFENQVVPLHDSWTSDCRDSENMHARRYNTALDRFQSIRRQGVLSRLKKKVLHRSQWLYDLNDFKSQFAGYGSCYAGIQVVRISSIIGTEGRTADFDIDFYPLQETSRERWVNMAVAHLARLALPPIELIQVGSVYFVRDGHHRISVSRAFGQIAMDAEVITYNGSHPFPWQADTLQKRDYVLIENSDMYT